jgi:hypothetical protein
MRGAVSTLLVNGLGYTKGAKTVLAWGEYVETVAFKDQIAIVWPIYWANALAHEQIWLGAAGLVDSDTFTGDNARDIGSKSPAAKTPATISKGSESSLIRGLGRTIDAIGHQ